MSSTWTDYPTITAWALPFTAMATALATTTLYQTAMALPWTGGTLCTSPEALWGTSASAAGPLNVAHAFIVPPAGFVHKKLLESIAACFRAWGRKGCYLYQSQHQRYEA